LHLQYSLPENEHTMFKEDTKTRRIELKHKFRKCIILVNIT